MFIVLVVTPITIVGIFKRMTRAVRQMTIAKTEDLSVSNSIIIFVF